MKLSPDFRRELVNAIKLSGVITGCVLGVLAIQSRGQSPVEDRAPASAQEDASLEECKLDDHGQPIRVGSAVPPYTRKPCRMPAR